MIPDLIDFTKTFFAKHTILNILTKYCVFTSENMLMVMRPYQITATERILNRIEIAHNYKKYGDIAGGGYIWHTTGSGKTLTSFKTARLASNLSFVDTPYYLKEKYKGIFANNIYVRLQDSNTPVDKSADFHHVEYLWKKRFGMLLSPIEKVKLYLKHPEHWANSPASEDKKYYKYAPEFTIDHTYEPEDGRDGYEYYLFAQTDSRAHWSEIRICYHQTVLAELGGVILDGGRYFTATPDRDGISLTEYHNWDVPYRYMVKGNLNHLVHEFYYVDDGDEARHSHNEYEGCILIFEDEKEHQRFKIYVRKNWDRKDEFVNDIWIPHMEQLPGYNMDAFREEYLNVQILRRMLQEFRNNGNTKN